MIRWLTSGMKSGGPRLTLEHEDLGDQEQLPQMVVSPPVAQPELEHRLLEFSDQALRGIKTGALRPQTAYEALKPAHLYANPIG